jgi:hypothetical protein
MKKVLLIALLALPVALSAQTKGVATTTPTPQKESKNMPQPKDAQNAFVELIISENTAGGATMRFDVGKEQPSYFADKELIQQLAEMRGFQVANTPDAFSYLMSIGFRFIDSYQVKLGDRQETHLIFQRDIRRGKETAPATKPAESTRPPANNPRVTAPAQQKK